MAKNNAFISYNQSHNINRNTIPPHATINNYIQANYNTAIQYYKSKEKIFQNLLAKEGTNVYEEFKEYLKETSKLFKEKVLDVVDAKIHSWINTGNQKHLEPVSSDTEYAVTINEILAHSVTWTSKDGSRGGIVAGTGMPYEKFLINRSESINLGPISNLLHQYALQHIGQATQKAATRTRKSEVGSDVGISRSGQSIKQGIESGEIKIELTAVIDLEDNPFEELKDGNVLLNALAADGITDDIFGFQLKAYDNSNDARWMNSKVLKNAINDIMETTRKNGERTPWASEYAGLYPYYYLSRFILNIVNPVNVGVITLNGIETMSSFLSRYRFYMEVGWRSPRNPQPVENSEYGGGVWIFPYVSNDTVLLREMTEGATKLLATGHRIENKRRKVAEVIWK